MLRRALLLPLCGLLACGPADVLPSDTRPLVPLQVTPQTAGWATPARVYVPRVKRRLTGLAATAAEINAAAAGGLPALISGWLRLPEAEAPLLAFFRDALQQRLAGPELVDEAAREGSVFQALQEALPRTALALLRERRPFTEIVTGDRFVLTAELAAYLLHRDERTTLDDGRERDLLHEAAPGWRFALTSRAVPLAATLDPQSSDYLTFADPALAQAGQAGCVDGVGSAESGLLFRFLVSSTTDLPGCYYGGAQSPSRDADRRDWRWRRLRVVGDGEAPDVFWDLPRLRTSDELRVRTPRVGFFTSPAFFAAWPTNEANSHRVTAHQTLLAALGRGTSVDTPLFAAGGLSGEDGVHAAPPCVGCHQVLDPLRDWFRNFYTLSGTAQLPPGTRAARLAFAGVDIALGSVADLGRALADHPRFAVAVTQQLCVFANAAPCREDDPEFLRLAQGFAAGGFDLGRLFVDLFSSPLVTDARPTRTGSDQGAPVYTARREGLCGTLAARLALPGLCQDPGVAPLAALLPGDNASRGQALPALVTAPDLFFQGATEVLCQRATDFAVGPDGTYRGDEGEAALPDLVARLMGLSVADPRAAEASMILGDHYREALAAGETPAGALRATLVLACLSPTMLLEGL